MKLRTLSLLGALLASAAFRPAFAVDFKWANDGDVGAMDPYTRFHKIACQQLAKQHGSAGKASQMCTRQLQQAFNQRHTASAQMFTTACRAGKLAAAKWLRALCDLDFAGLISKAGGTMLELASATGNLAMLQWLHAQGACMKDDALAQALPYPECVKWLLKQNPSGPISFDLTAGLLRRGDLPLLKWILHNAPSKLSLNELVVGWLTSQLDKRSACLLNTTSLDKESW